MSDGVPFLNLAEIEAAARERLTALAYEYYVGGANDEVTVRENRSAFERLALRYRVLVDVSRRSTQTSVLGQSIELPVLLAPTAFQRLACDEGEIAAARAAATAGTIMILSTASTCTIEDVGAVPGPKWFQLYVYTDRSLTEALIARAEAAGMTAIVLTVDAPMLGRRERDLRNRFHLPDGVRLANVPSSGSVPIPTGHGESGLAIHFASGIDASLTWRDVEWLRSRTRLPVLIKGIVRGDDAARAIDHGAAGIIVSNHGGRQLDTAIPTIRALPEVVDAVAGRVDVLLDGGVRRGTDVIKAIALGARAVLVGRPVVWGLAAGGEAGVRRVLDLLRSEIDLAMALCGCPTVADISRDLVA
ncbi:MAG: alpha-hydroxyacid dehydrogenase, FMN-dependent L-lactate dehydrogenase [Geminicoccaceae bacterium]|nr:alpha-hydroxyacid dehydrogenase, FMN-dependent L-lactate dehydrogenase [Geminicoccaceae bacterium]